MKAFGENEVKSVPASEVLVTKAVLGVRRAQAEADRDETSTNLLAHIVVYDHEVAI